MDQFPSGRTASQLTARRLLLAPGVITVEPVEHPLQAAVCACACRSLAVLVEELKRSGATVEGEVKAKVLDETGQVQCVVIFASNRPWKVAPAPLPVPMPLNDVEDAAFQASPAHDQKGVTMKRLAKLAGYAYTGHFREAVHRLHDWGFLIVSRRSVRRSASGQTPPSAT